MRVLSNFKFTLILLLLCVYVSVGQNLNCGIPSWYDDIAYADPGGTAKVYSYVEYNGKVYINNKYIGSNEATPNLHSGWDEMGSCSDISKLPLADNCSSGVDTQIQQITIQETWWCTTKAYTK